VNWHEAMENFRGHREPHIDIIGRKRLWFTVSGILVVLSLVGLLFRGLNYSIDFEGGTLLRYPCPNCASGEVTADDVSSRLAELGFADAEVQIVNGDEVTVRTRSLTTLGRPSTSLRMPNEAGATATAVRAVLAEFGRSGAAVSVSSGAIRVKTKPLANTVRGIVLSYDNSAKNTPIADIRSTLSDLGYAGAEVLVFGDTVVVRFGKLPLHPPPPPTPSPSPSPETSASASPTPTAQESPGPSPTPTSSSAAAQPSGSPQPAESASPSPDVTLTPDAQTSATPPVATPTPIPSPTPTIAGREEVIAKLATQAGLQPTDIDLRNLSETNEDDVIAALADVAGVSPADVKVKEISGKEQQRLLQALADQAGTDLAQVNRQDVGPTWGGQISSKAVKGLIIFLILVTIYIAFRFEWKMAVAAQTALLHDLLITAGIYALVGRVVSPATVIAILTILGYSLYDTVVIFDKVKENTESQSMVAREGYSGVVNISLNQVLMRSVNTSLVVLLPILSLLLIGGSTLKDFAFALFVGVASGTYSSIFMASPMLALLKEREPKNRQIHQRLVQRASKPQLQTVPAGSGPPARSTTPASRGTEAEPAASAEPGGDGGDGRTRPTPRPGQPKKKRKTTAAQRRRR
jgi:preprotein translocase subunit SecF